MVTVDEFLALYDDFSTVDRPKVQANLDFCARNYCKGKVWGEARKDAVMLRAAHRGTMLWFQTAQMAAAATAVSKGAAPPSQQAVDNELLLTTYGRQYIELRSRLPITGFPA